MVSPWNEAFMSCTVYSDFQCDVKHSYKTELQPYFDPYNRTFLQDENKENNT
jgi:hypothetical protein